MFLNKTKFKKMIKGAFNIGGLTVGRVYGGIILCGGNWVTWTEDGYIPNWLKAAVMECTGELPEIGTIFKAKKDAPIQYEIAENELYDLPGTHRKCRCAFTVTPICISTYANTFRVLQQRGSQEMLSVSEFMYEAIDLSELEEENAPSGPASVSATGGLLIWKNEHSAYAFTSYAETQTMINNIMYRVQDIDFSKEGE